MARFDSKVKIKMKQKKSQVTMLIIIGLVIFILVSLVLYIYNSSIKKLSEQNIKKSQETAIEAQPIKEFVAKCLDKLAKDATLLLGKQGGYIYITQGGTLIDPEDTDEGISFIKYKDAKVGYNIMRPKIESLYPGKSHYYPWPTFPYETTSSSTEIFDGYFGENAMPPLYHSNTKRSFQSQIESYIDTNIVNCINIDVFRQQGYDITINPSNTSIIIGDDDFTVKSKIPMTVNNPSTKEFYQLSDFSTKVDIRLKDIYYLIENELISNDINNVIFDIKNVAGQDSLKVKVIENEYGKDDIIIVTDEKSTIYGKTFEYVFARRNRPPALYYYTENLQLSSGSLITEDFLLQNKPLKAEDPDEDSLTFTTKDLSNNQILSRPFSVTFVPPQMEFNVSVSDGQLSDYQIIVVSIP